MESEHARYIQFAGPAMVCKAIESLAGLIEGIALDGHITAEESAFLIDWLNDHSEFADKHPFTELVPVLRTALADDILTEDERLDILWLCDRLREETSHGRVNLDMQRLHAILGGIVADRVVSPEELAGLRDWLDDHDDLRTVWPYDEIDSLVTGVMRDGTVSEDEQAMLFEFFSQFVHRADDRVIGDAGLLENQTIVGLCAVCPEIEFESNVFTFTGASSHYTRSEFASIVERLGGEHSPNVTRRTNYLVVGADGNPCWAYACYGRKVEAAVKLRRKGLPVLIVHELDLRDAVLDCE